MVNGIQFTLEGEMPSKKNRWRSGNGRVYIPKELQKEIDDFLWQLKGVRAACRLSSPMAGSILLTVVFITKQNLDLDNMVTTLQDLLQRAAIIKNDHDIVSVRADVSRRSLVHPTVHVELAHV